MVETGAPVPELPAKHGMMELPAKLGMMALTPEQMLAMTLVLPMTLTLPMVRSPRMEGTSRVVGKFSEIILLYTG